jgi:hypothetical protein
MDISEFTANYSELSDDQLLCLWAERDTLVSDAATALDSEIQKRGLKKSNAERIKKRVDRLAARVGNGALAKRADTAKYERGMRQFVGWQEPKFYSPYGSRDIRKTFARFRHRYRVWKAFRDHTGHWPVSSIWFYFLSWMAVFGLAVTAFLWTAARKWTGAWATVVVIGCVLVLVGVRELGARLIRKLDWKRFGA